MGENAVDPAALDALADDLRVHDLDIGRGVETILRSRAFFAVANLGTCVVGPAEFVVGSARALELLDPPPSTPVLADWVARLGQDLFHPPNVGGWPGGRAWITTRSAIGRANFASAMVDGSPVGLPGPLDVAALAARHGQAANPTYLARLLIGPDSRPSAIRGRRSVSAALDRLDDFALADRERAPLVAPRDDLGRFLERSLLDAYATSDRLDTSRRPATASRNTPKARSPRGSG